MKLAREFVVIASGDDKEELMQMLLYYQAHQRLRQSYDLVDLCEEPGASIRSVYRFHLVRQRV
jgi:hypothetical protein